jgi:outer membrane protein OmpA-like peptidoglycan-associated protein
MKVKLLAGAALAAMFAATGASAQVVNGWYGALDLGYHMPEGIEASSESTAPAYYWTFDSEDDWTGFARLGYRVNPNWRVELEGGYRPGELESVRGRSTDAVTGLCAPGVIRTTAAPTCQSPSGEIEAWTLMANVLFDLLPAESRFRPFIGAGIGVNRLKIEAIGQVSNVPSGLGPAIQNVVIDDEDVNVAWQGIAGLAYSVTEQLAVDLTYRYLSGSEVDFDATGSAATGVQPGSFTGRYDDQSVTVGLRYSFAPPPAIEPVAPPQPQPYTPPVVDTPPVVQPTVEQPRAVAREFLVYFPFDQSILTPEAQTVVQEAASYAQQGNATQIAVVGHADTSGSAAYNVRLSERRARAVADAMVGLGVNPGIITADWRGETQPAVSTGDGVREPLNRRATVNVNF